MLNEFRRKLADITRSSNYVETFADPSRRLVYVDNYSYVVDGDNLGGEPITSDATTSFDLIMDTDSDFVLFGMSGFGRDVGSQELSLNPSILAQVTDRSSGRTFFNQPAPLAMIAGQGGFPFMPTSPRVIGPRTTLTAAFTSASTANFSGVYLALHGSRLFYA